VKGSTLCPQHGGYRKLTAVKRGVSRFYSQALGPKLKERLESFLNQPNHTQLALYEEIAISRAAANEALKLAFAVFELPEKKSTNNARALAAQAVQQAMEHVASLVEKAAKIEAHAGDKVSIQTIDLFVAQMAQIIMRICSKPMGCPSCGKEHSHDKIAEELVLKLKETIRIPTREASINTNVELQILHGSISPLTDAMDATTVSSDPKSTMEEQSEIRCGSSGEEEWEDGTSEEEID